MKIILTGKEMTETTGIVNAIEAEGTAKLLDMCSRESSVAKVTSIEGTDRTVIEVDDKFVTLALKIIGKYTNVIVPLFTSIYNIGKVFSNELYTSLKTFATNYRKEKKQS